jgi:hypothetical protein
MSIFDKKAVESACSEAQLCRDYPEYWIMKYLLGAPEKVVGNFKEKEQYDRYSHIDEKVVKQYFKYFGINC